MQGPEFKSQTNKNIFNHLRKYKRLNQLLHVSWSMSIYPKTKRVRSYKYTSSIKGVNVIIYGKPIERWLTKSKLNKSNSINTN